MSAGNSSARTAELQAANEALRASRVAALNLMEDALAARRKAEEAEESLRESERRYWPLSDRNPDGVFAVDPTGRFILANPACELLSGYSAAELLRKTFIDLCAPDQSADTLAHFERSARQQAYAELETALIRKDGRRLELCIAGATPKVILSGLNSVSSPFLIIISGLFAPEYCNFPFEQSI